MPWTWSFGSSGQAAARRSGRRPETATGGRGVSCALALRLRTVPPRPTRSRRSRPGTATPTGACGRGSGSPAPARPAARQRRSDQRVGSRRPSRERRAHSPGCGQRGHTRRRVSGAGRPRSRCRRQSPPEERALRARPRRARWGRRT
eukprot:6106598-Prymnesium_polylepis.1